MQTIRRMLCEGKDRDEIQEAIGVSKRTLQRYLDKLFTQDREALEGRNYQDLLDQICILKNRYNQQYEILYQMATDNSIPPNDRLGALAGLKMISDNICRLYQTSPGVAVLQQRKLEGLKTATLRFDGIGAYLPAPTNPYVLNHLQEHAIPALSTAEEEEQQQQQEEEQGEPIYDHEFTDSSNDNGGN